MYFVENESSNLPENTHSGVPEITDTISELFSGIPHGKKSVEGEDTEKIRIS